MLKLHLTRERAALEPRREPYCGAPLGRGRVLKRGKNAAGRTAAERQSGAVRE